MAQAIASFTRLGYDVSIPLTESAAYDLIVDSPEGLRRVQVRYTSTEVVGLRRIHSNSQGYVVKKACRGIHDWLYIFKSNGEEYLLTAQPKNENSIKPTNKDLLKNKYGGVG